MLGRLRRRRRAHNEALAAELARIPGELVHDFDAGHAGFTRETPTGAALLERPPDELTSLVVDALEIAAALPFDEFYSKAWRRHRACTDFAATVLRRSLPFDDAQLAALLEHLAAVPGSYRKAYLDPGSDPIKPAIQTVETHAAGGVAAASLHRGLRKVAKRVDDDSADGRAVLARIARLLGEEPPPIPGGDPWSAAMLGARANPDADRLLAVAATATAAKPSKAFRTERDALLEEVGADAAGALAGRMLEAAVAVRGSDRIGIPSPEVGDVLRGLAFIVAAAGHDDAARVLADLAIAGWRKVPQYGPLCSKAANAAINGLAEVPDGAPQLGRIRGQLKRATAVAAVDAAIERAAERLGMAPAEFEERVVPDFGLEGGTRTATLGEHTAVLDGAGGLTFISHSGRTLKSVPKAVREEHPDELAELKRTAKDIKAMATGQRLRLERLLTEDRSWTGAEFRERYLEHGLLAPLARRLIWMVDGESTMFGDEPPADDATVRLWHPVDAPAEEVHVWRRELEAAEITQPFKQAHREVYLLTEAERTTETYSNRFAAHVLRQHQMAALAETRGWRYRLQGGFDSGSSEAELELPASSLKAAFWVDPPLGTGDLSESGIFMHVLTDQVRFTDDDEAVPLEQIPARVFSEVMRDVDLFVGVTSIGNDPTWGDHGGRQYGEYWTEYAFGELGEQAEVRRDLLERLLPKLAIAGVAELDGRYLRVRGKLRTYRIHLGSSNILMEPNDAYLCIVTGRDPNVRGNVYLPFEGDHMLAVILSKALLLARDDKIDDKSITAQIAGR